jgi:hypothetical protein
LAKLTPDQLHRRNQVETLIRLMAPGLNLVLAFGERLSRIVEKDDPEYYPPRVEGVDAAAIRGARDAE